MAEKVKIQETNLLRYSRFERINGFPTQGVICVFSNRQLNNMSLCYGDTTDSLDNRNNFLKGLGLNYRDLICAKQIHASRIRNVGEGDRGRGSLSYDASIEGTDAFITRVKNLPLAIFTADCLSIFLYDYKTPAIGLIHAGWRSSKENIASKTIQLMQENFKSCIDQLYVGFGPSIKNCCYEVGAEFKKFFPYGVSKRENRYYLDLIGINKKQILGLGVREKNIFDSGVCTSCRNVDFFSYRKEGVCCGRMMSVMMLK